MATADTAHRRMFAPGSTALATSPPRLIHKRSDSVPDGWYRTSPTNSLAPGDLVLVRLPREARSLAAQRGYLLEIAPLLKTVAAMVPQHVCMQDSQVQCASMASLLPGSCAGIDRVARC